MIVSEIGFVNIGEAEISREDHEGVLHTSHVSALTSTRVLLMNLPLRPDTFAPVRFLLMTFATGMRSIDRLLTKERVVPDRTLWDWGAPVPFAELGRHCGGTPSAFSDELGVGAHFRGFLG